MPKAVLRVTIRISLKVFNYLVFNYAFKHFDHYRRQANRPIAPGSVLSFFFKDRGDILYPLVGWDYATSYV